MLAAEDQVHVSCCHGSQLRADPRVQAVVYTSPSRTKEVKNLKGVDYLFYAPPRSRSWKRLKWFRILYMLFVAISYTSWVFAMLFLDKTQLAQTAIEFVGVGFIGFSLGFPLLWSNLDTALMRLKTLLFVVDLASYLVVSIVLLIFGEGFYILGALYFFGPLVLSYSVEGVEVDARLNSRNASTSAKVIKYMGYVSFVVSLVTLRAAVFFKQVSISPGIVLATFSNGEVLTLLNFWEFWVDVLVVRLLSISLTRIIQPGTAISLGPAYAKV